MRTFRLLAPWVLLGTLGSCISPVQTTPRGLALGIFLRSPAQEEEPGAGVARTELRGLGLIAGRQGLALGWHRLAHVRVPQSVEGTSIDAPWGHLVTGRRAEELARSPHPFPPCRHQP